ncbi:MAG: squalene/phytoene synthase family protein [Pseudomonadota bacterium]
MPSAAAMGPGSPFARRDDKIISARVRAAGSSFYWAMRLQPREKRAGLFAVYAFCREVDDIADGDAGVADPVRALESWAMRIDDIFDGEATTPLERTLVTAIERFGLRKADFLAIIEGMLLDAKGPIQRPQNAELIHYCDCVASAVGRLCIRIFGDASEAAKTLATEQGQALQLTNIMRDVEEDAQRQRIYIPRDILERHGLKAAPAEALAGHPELPAVRAELGALALARFKAAQAAAARCDQVAIRPAMMMMDAYRQTYDSWAANAWHPPLSTPLHKLLKRAFLIKKAIGLWVRQSPE